MSGAFAIKPKTASIIKGKRVLLLDDVLTTGATIASFGQTIADAEPADIRYFVFAAAEFT